MEEAFGQYISKRLAEMVGKRPRSGVRHDDVLARLSEDESVHILQGQMDQDRVIQISKRLLKDCAGTYLPKDRTKCADDTAKQDMN